MSERDRLRPEREEEAQAPASAAPARPLTSVDSVLALQRSAGNQATAGLLARKGAPDAAAEPRPLPDHIRAGIESLSGAPVGDLRVHYDSSLPAQMNALAYAQGNDIHLAPGQEQELPHEAWHVVQQREGRVAPSPMRTAPRPAQN